MSYEHHSSRRRRHYSSSSDTDSDHRHNKHRSSPCDRKSHSEHSSKRSLNRRKYSDDDSDHGLRSKPKSDLRSLIARRRDLKSYYDPEVPTESVKESSSKSYNMAEKLDIEIHIKNELHRGSQSSTERSRSRRSNSYHHEDKNHSYNSKQYSKIHSKQKVQSSMEPKSRHEKKLFDFKKSLEEKFDVSIDSIVKEILQTKSSSQIKDMLNVDINTTSCKSTDIKKQKDTIENSKNSGDMDSFSQLLNTNTQSQQTYNHQQNYPHTVSATTPLQCPPFLPPPLPYNYVVPTAPLAPSQYTPYNIPNQVQSIIPPTQTFQGMPGYLPNQIQSNILPTPLMPTIPNYGSYQAQNTIPPTPPLPGMPNYRPNVNTGNARNPINNERHGSEVQNFITPSNLPVRPKLKLIQIKDSSNTVIRVIDQEDGSSDTTNASNNKAQSQQKNENIGTSLSLENDKLINKNKKSVHDRLGPIAESIKTTQNKPNESKPAEFRSTTPHSYVNSSSFNNQPAVKKFKPGMYDTQSFDYTGEQIVCKTPHQLIKTLNKSINFTANSNQIDKQGNTTFRRPPLLSTPIGPPSTPQTMLLNDGHMKRSPDDLLKTLVVKRV